MSAFVRIVATVGTALIFLSTACGLASADPLVGKTYSDASATVSGWGNTPVIETVVGSRLAISDCLVSSWTRSVFKDDGGAQRKVGAILLNINCNAAYASAGKPGPSIASPEGRTAKKQTETGEWCSLPDQADNEACAKFCNGFKGVCTVTF